MNVQETSPVEADAPPSTARGSFFEVFGVFLRLGLTSFGGPIAHLSYFRSEIVVRRKWVSEQTYADLVALCQFLPGPSSSQVGISLGLARTGLLGGLAAWLGFTLPSALAMVLFAYTTTLLKNGLDAGWIHGLLLVAVAVVAQAVWGMAQKLCPDRPRATVALVVAVISLLWISPLTAIVLLALTGLFGWRWLRQEQSPAASSLALGVPRRLSIACLALFFALLLGLPLLRFFVQNQALALFDTFFRVGSLVFGGGHVVLPLLQHEVVPAGWLNNDQFLTGYAAAQAVPGPLFSFSAYLGALSHPSPNGWLGAGIALVGIYLPSFLLLLGLLPFWNYLRALVAFQAALRGINAAVVGILLAALYQPIWTSAVHAPLDFALVLGDFALLTIWKCPPWAVVLLSAVVGIGLHALHVF